MEIDLNKLEVIHNPQVNRFETWIDGNLSKLDYIPKSSPRYQRTWIRRPRWGRVAM